MKKPTYDPVADEGIFTVGRIFNREFGWAYRPQPVADFGIDAHVEICEEGEPTGKFIFLQVKAGHSYFGESTEDGYIFRGSERHYRYWTSLPVPVLLVLYDPSSETAYWQIISSKTVSFTKKGFKTLVSSNSRLNAEQKSELFKTIDIGNTNPEYSAIALGVEIDGSEELLEVNRLSDGAVRGHKLKELGDQFNQNMKAKVADSTERLWNGVVSISEWEAEIAQTIKSTFVCQFALAMGGINAVDSINLKRISNMIRQQFKSLRTLSCDIIKERYFVSELQEVIERSELFIDCSVLAFEMGQAIHGEVEYYPQGNGDWKANIPRKPD